jgi:hypothetical protein
MHSGHHFLQNTMQQHNLGTVCMQGQILGASNEVVFSSEISGSNTVRLARSCDGAKIREISPGLNTAGSVTF